MKNYKFKLLLLSISLFGLFSCNNQSNNDLKLDFTNFKKLTYDYEQTMENYFSIGMDQKSFSDAKGTLIISVKENGKADIVFKKLKITMFSIAEDGEKKEIMSQTMPDFFMQDMNEYGKIEGFMDQQNEMLAKILFPIPKEKIKVGEINKLPISIPFNITGSTINVKGFNEVTLKSINNNLGVIATVIDASEYEIPEDANVNVDCFLKGTSEYTFDFSKGYFKTASIDINMVAKSLPNNDEQLKENSNIFDKMKDNMKDFGLEMKTKIKFSLKKVE